MTNEDDISFLKWKVSDLEKQIAHAEESCKSVQNQFAGFNGQFQEARQMFPQMQTKYNELVSRFDIRMKSFEEKLELLLRLTMKKVEAKTQKGEERFMQG
jgi:DNA anti-recombination protein RmuC